MTGGRRGNALERSGKQADWNTVSAEYRKLLHGVGEEKGLNEDGSPTRPGFTRDEILAEMEAGGQLPLWKALRCRMRYFADGGVFGSDEFLKQHFERKRSDYSVKRQTGARKMRNAGWDGSRVLCDLRVDVFGSTHYYLLHPPSPGPPALTAPSSIFTLLPLMTTSDFTDLDLPTPPEPLADKRVQPEITWQQFMDETATETAHYLQEHNAKNRRPHLPFTQFQLP